MNRITRNEEKLDSVLSSIKELNNSLVSFKLNIINIHELNKYYGSKSWFKDKDDYENNRIKKVKAGVLSEDAVWNMNEEINDLIFEMKKIIKELGGTMEKEKCTCGPDCTCGCQEGKECTCTDENCSCGCDDNCECDESCTCGCQNDK